MIKVGIRIFLFLAAAFLFHVRDVAAESQQDPSGTIHSLQQQIINLRDQENRSQKELVSLKKEAYEARTLLQALKKSMHSNSDTLNLIAEHERQMVLHERHWEEVRLIEITIFWGSLVALAGLLGFAGWWKLVELARGMLQSVVEKTSAALARKTYIVIASRVATHHLEQAEALDVAQQGGADNGIKRLEAFFGREKSRHMEIAIDLARDAAIQAEELPGPEYDQWIGKAKNNLAYFLASQGKTEDADTAKRAANQVFELARQKKPHHPWHLWMDTYIFTFLRYGDAAEQTMAQRLIKQVLEDKAILDLEWKRKRYAFFKRRLPDLEVTDADVVNGEE